MLIWKKQQNPSATKICLSATVTMPKTKECSVGLREEVVNCHKNGEVYDKIASRPHPYKSTVVAPLLGRD